MSVALSPKRRLSIKRVMSDTLYRKHNNGIKYTKVYFRKGKSPIKIDQQGNHIKTNHA